MSNPFQHRLQEAEEVHKLFFSVHADLRDAHEKLNKALRVLMVLDEHRETREKAKRTRQEIERIRDLSEALLLDASNVRSELIGITGCDGSCC